MYVPPELIEVILRAVDLDSESLKACSLVAPAFRSPSQRMLLSSFTLDPLARTTSFLAASTLLAESPHVASYVTRLAISLPLEFLTSSDVESLIQIFDRLVNVQKCIVDGGYHATTFGWNGIPPRLQSGFTDYFSRQSLDELHVISICNIPSSTFFRFLRAARGLFLYRVGVVPDPAAVGLEHSYPMTRLGLLTGTRGLCEILANMETFQAPNLQRLDITGDSYSSSYANKIISSTSETLEHLTLHCLDAMNFGNSALRPALSLPVLKSAEITAHRGREAWFLDMLKTLLVPDTAPILRQLTITYTHLLESNLFHLLPSTRELNTVDTLLMAHPGSPSIQWRLDLSEHAHVNVGVSVSSFVEDLHRGLPQAHAKGRLSVEHFTQRFTLPYITGKH
ncbi:hypothetical protein B0H16DRAFT_1528272 [Mycena metata]|uniref:Uncharacterized protein n=1 Tax=Mycena metata TaxID=1033252 RepID=A0AAD7JHT0_9AGAR|nr:hypothetical protein B0H16DRAFT_1528272 [Mycena metata]